jgi:hypothetical protein
MSYFAVNPSGNLLEKIGDSLRDAIPKLEKNIIRVVIEYIKDDIRIHSKVAKPKILIACDKVGKSKDEQEVVQLLLYSLIDNDDDLECFFTGLSLRGDFIRSRHPVRSSPSTLFQFISGACSVFRCGIPVSSSFFQISSFIRWSPTNHSRFRDCC